MNHTFKSAMMKQWSVSDDKVIIGKKEVAITDIVKIDQVNMPKNSLQNGTVGLTTPDGKWHLLAFPYGQRVEAAEAIEYIKMNSSDERAKILAELEHREFRMRCKVCGKVTCFTMNDLRTNQKLARQAALHAGVSAFSALFGTRYDAYEQGKIADHAANRIIDYTKCPDCNSTDVEMLTDEQWETATAAKNEHSTLSAADEIMKYKNLLDSGIITQDEFDAKKKQLLGL